MRRACATEARAAAWTSAEACNLFGRLIPVPRLDLQFRTTGAHLEAAHAVLRRGLERQHVLMAELFADALHGLVDRLLRVHHEEVAAGGAGQGGQRPFVRTLVVAVAIVERRRQTVADGEDVDGDVDGAGD